MDLEEANFILNQMSISEPCISGYAYITVEQVDEAVDVINNELKKRELRIRQLEKELERSRKLIDNKFEKEEKFKIKSELLSFKINQKEAIIV